MSDLIQSMYTILEDIEKYIKPSSMHQIVVDTLRPSMLDESIPAEEKACIENEIFVLEANIDNSCLSREFLEYSYGIAYPVLPDIAVLNDYLLKRTDNTTNYFIKSKYDSILWHINMNIQFGIDASKSYLKCSEELIKRNDEIPVWYVISFLKHALNIAIILRKSNPELCENVYSVINTILMNTGNDGLVYESLLLINNTLKNYKRHLPHNISSLLYTICENLYLKKNYNSAIENALICQKICNKLGKNDSKIWFTLIANSYFAHAHLSDDPYLTMTTVQKAAGFYNMAGDSNRKDQCNREASSLWEKVKTTFKEVDISKAVDPKLFIDIQLETKKICKILGNFPIISIIQFLTQLPSIMLRIEDLNSPMPIAYSICSVQMFDQHGNQPIAVRTKEELEEHWKNEQYSIRLRLYIDKLKYIIYYLVVNNKLNFILLEDTVLRSSWIGHTTNHSKSWWEVIKPSIQYYFSNMDILFSSNFKCIPDFSLSMDSLVLKFEGMIRDLFQINGISTKHNMEKEGKQISQELDINGLLYHSQAKNIFDQNNLEFMKFILIKQDGYNFRNVIAHSLESNLYSYLHMNLVFIIFLMIIAYE